MPLSRQVYLGLPDGGLSYDDKLRLRVAEVAFDFGPQRVFTTGEFGYDGHLDHIASHIAAIGAVSLLRESGHDVLGWALDEGHEGQLYSGDYWQKVGAMALHASQVVTSDLERWGDTDLYSLLISKGESFQVF